MNKVKIFALFVVAILVVAISFISSCKHDLVYNNPITPIDTSHHPVDTNHVPVDTFHCDTCAAGVISYTEDVAPILQSNCGMTGCHNATSHKDGLNVTTYSTLMGGSHAPTNLTGSFWQAINGTGGDPMPPGGSLTAAQLLIIQTWIQQGSQNTTCTHICKCDTTNISFANYIYPTLQTYCTGCHQAGSAQGGVDLSSYANVQAQVNNGKLIKTITWQTGPGIVAMPYNGSKLNDCTISKFQAWVNAGAPNN
jgi:hypothetical protein